MEALGKIESISKILSHLHDYYKKKVRDAMIQKLRKRSNCKSLNSLNESQIKINHSYNRIQLSTCTHRKKLKLIFTHARFVILK